ncbi:hypothetical protein K474DRAFT_1677207 [Panus rudis PR-1116 ss-1]|nr:hypothetical protein K474DRAFT_1677207 [Panus rudis PR-1116 ss-1]
MSQPSKRVRRPTERQQELIEKKEAAAARKAANAEKAKQKAEATEAKRAGAPAPRKMTAQDKRVATHAANLNTPGAPGSITVKSTSLVQTNRLPANATPAAVPESVQAPSPMAPAAAMTTTLAAAAAPAVRPRTSVPRPSPSRVTTGVKGPLASQAAALSSSLTHSLNVTPVAKAHAVGRLASVGAQKVISQTATPPKTPTNLRTPIVTNTLTNSGTPTNTLASRAPTNAPSRAPTPNHTPTNTPSRIGNNVVVINPPQPPPVLLSKMSSRSVGKTATVARPSSSSSGSRSAVALDPRPRLAPERLAAPPVTVKAPVYAEPRVTGFDDSAVKAALQGLCDALPRESAPQVLAVFQTLFNATQRRAADGAASLEANGAVTGDLGLDQQDMKTEDICGTADAEMVGSKRRHTDDANHDIECDLPTAPKSAKVEKGKATPLRKAFSSEVVKLRDLASEIFRSKMATECAFPTDSEKWVHDCWAQACNEHNVECSMTPDLFQWIHKTATSFRSNVKRDARTAIDRAFDFKPGPKNAQKNEDHARELLTADTFIYPESEHAKEPGSRKFMYENDAISTFIHQAFFSTTSAIGIRRADEFGSAMPISAIAFACTMIHFAISEWAGGKWVNAKFDATPWKSVYDHHVRRLEAGQEAGAQAARQGHENKFKTFTKKMLYDARLQCGADVGDIDDYDSDMEQPLEELADAEDEWKRDVERAFGNTGTADNHRKHRTASEISNDEATELLKQVLLPPKSQHTLQRTPTPHPSTGLFTQPHDAPPMDEDEFPEFAAGDDWDVVAQKYNIHLPEELINDDFVDVDPEEHAYTAATYGEHGNEGEGEVVEEWEAAGRYGGCEANMEVDVPVNSKGDSEYDLPSQMGMEISERDSAVGSVVRREIDVDVDEEEQL